MAKQQQQQYSNAAESLYDGISLDTDPIDQPKGSTRYVLNGVNEASDGKQQRKSNEKGFAISTNIPDGFFIIGDKYLEDNQTALILINPTTNRAEIGILDKDDDYVTVVNIGSFGLSISNQCDIRYRKRRGNERVIYWVDGLNKARSFNFDRLYNYYTTAYKTYLKAGGDPSTYSGEKFEVNSFNLEKTYSSIPFFSNVDVKESGAITPGSYNFAVQYVDQDLNPTEWITTSNTVNIYNDSVDTAYYKIRGSRNANNAIQSFEKANKSIVLTLTNLDTSFPYYRVAIIPSTSLDGTPTQALLSDIQSTNQSQFIYSGNDGALTKGSLEDILIENEIIFAPQHIEQLENRLIIANTKGKSVNWCDYQKYASKIKSDLATKDVILNSVLSEPNLKNAKSTFTFRGYMPGETYSFGIAYLFTDGTISPVFHIPGPALGDSSTQMVHYATNTNYQDIHNCSTNNYWGDDSQGNALVGESTRHHRFPFRKDVGLPLFTRDGSTTTINTYKLTFKIELNPAFVPTAPDPGGWPVDGGGTALVLSARIVYQIGTGSTITINQTLTQSNLGGDIIIYDDVDDLSDVTSVSGTIPVTGTTKEVLKIVSGTVTDYMDIGGTNPRFILTGTYAIDDTTSVYNTDSSKIFGIEFSNIEKPSEDVVGFYIMRNERTDDDKLIIDNALFGPMIENGQYKSFGLINPKQYYPVTTVDSNCNPNGTSDSGKTITYYNKGMWFFNPEYQFMNKKLSFNSINIQGQYFETGINLPSRKADYWEENNGCTNWRGLYIQDVQAGTSYNADVNKGKDSDGFDMLAGYRNTDVNFQVHNFTAPDIDRSFFLNAATYQNYDSAVLYNVSCDNKVGILYFDSVFSTEEFYNTTTKKNNLLYGSLVKDNDTAYSNFMYRSYYKEHNNPFLFNDETIINNVQVFNGDAYISPITITSSVFYDILVAIRSKKSRVWQIIVGAVLVVAGVVASVFTAGASSFAVAAGIGVLSAAAISYGVSLAMSGIKFEQFKSMIDSDYSKGLKDTVVDGAVYECIRDSEARADDTIRWFVDRVNSVYIESSIPFALRDGLTSGVPDFIDSPNQFNEDEFRDYIMEKLTTIDRDQGSGRLYKGYATAEFYSMNPDYMRFNKEKVFIHLPLEYDCCSDYKEDFPTRIWYSEQSFQEEQTDNFRVFLPNNYRDIEGEHGEITNLYRMGNALFVHCKEALWQLPQNVQERVTNEIVSFIGTGSFFSVPPRKVIDDNLGSGGTQHKWGSLKTKAGVFFINEIENKIYRHGEKVEDITNPYMHNWFKTNLRSFLVQQMYEQFGIIYPDNNPANPNGVGYISAYDTRHERIIFTKRDYLYIGDNSKIITAYDPSAHTYQAGQIFIDDQGFHRIVSQTGSTVVSEIIPLTDKTVFEDKSWTISYSLYGAKAKFQSWHSYLPLYYIHNQSNVYSFIGDNNVWKHNIEGLFQNYYGQQYPFIIEYVSQTAPILTKIWEDLGWQTSARRWNTDKKEYQEERFITFNKLTAYNTRQSTGEQQLMVKYTQPDSVDWYEHQTENTAGTIMINRREQDWSLNELRDYIIDPELPLFSKAWTDRKNTPYLDKVENSSNINFTKDWFDLEVLRDKYMIIRLKFDNFDDVNLVFNYSVETVQISNT